MSAFTADKTSDQKRLARAEHWRLARSILRHRDAVHHNNWQVLMLAGGSPGGEIGCIRELMPKAQITAIDRDPQCVAAAEAFGVEALQIDLAKWDTSSGREDVHEALKRRWSVINLDLCAGPTDETKKLVQRYSVLADVFLLTFSYGRDVAERFRIGAKINPQLIEAGVPNDLAARVSFLTGAMPLHIQRVPSARRHVVSVIAYAGASMPMCSLLMCRVNPAKHMAVKFVKLTDADFSHAVLEPPPNPSLLYDVPADRIEALRRSAAARKAVATRLAK